LEGILVWILSLALKVRKGTVADGGTMPMPTGLPPTEIGVPTTVLVAVSITETVLEIVFET
jgi:hypothetical protein